jgi:hypothetical protein
MTLRHRVFAAVGQGGQLRCRVSAGTPVDGFLAITYPM